jgi:hypothetical protein
VAGKLCHEGNGEVTVVGWSDGMEVVYPKTGTPFRLEVVLFTRIAAKTDDPPEVPATIDPETGLAWGPMMKYKMGVLAHPSRSSELQGTNGHTSELSDWATIVPNQPKLLVQYLGASVPGDLMWSTTSDQWTSASTTLVVNPVSFAVELNVGGKYIFDASKGIGRRPTMASIASPAARRMAHRWARGEPTPATQRQSICPVPAEPHRDTSAL